MVLRLVSAIPILAVILVAAVCMQAIPAHAEVKTFTSTIRQPFGGSQSPDDARTAAITRAKRLALEQAGTYLESMSLVRDAALEQEEILALTAGVSRVQVLKEEKYLDGEQFGLEITAQVEVDTAVLEERVRKLLEDRKHLEELQAAQEREKELLAKVEALEEENQELSKAVETTHNEMHKQRIQEQFKQATLELGAVDHFQAALAQWCGGRFQDPRKALDSLNRAIYLDPQYGAAYGNRGIAQGQLGHFLNAISDFNTALRLDPARSSAYLTNRGYAHLQLNQNREAVVDFTSALDLDPRNPIAHCNKGLALSRLGDAKAAMAEFDMALQLDPGFALAWFNRGFLHDGLGNSIQALKDYTKALSLDQDLAEAYFNRGVLRLERGDSQGAVSDFTAYLVESPEDVDARLLRGKAFGRLGRTGLMCIDFEAACRQGFCKHWNSSRMQGACP